MSAAFGISPFNLTLRGRPGADANNAWV